MFPESERQIFPLARAGNEVAIDPMVAWRRLYAALDGQDLDAILERSGSPEPRARLDAHGQLGALACAAFDLQPLGDDGSGDTEAHAVGTLLRFFAWEADLKNGRGTTPSGSQPSESSPGPSTT